ncbi:hypothetical protein [Mucilaginibacter polytrichastri]|uniref:hypothetical protein n=1 Tax=Mucilaginibacter polytrichastri TaxID=1302689 RepID=UPI0008F26660|nr:hypothetical protein [Mucilaginibacter polytrichastri]SFT08581.1 hypothetical protein SAMN04487890_11042 [Mucilaginibacter polytrichastri]
MTEEFMNYDAVLKHFKTTKYTLDNLIAKEGMPFEIKNGEYVFCKSKLEDWLGDRIIRP